MGRDASGGRGNRQELHGMGGCNLAASRAEENEMSRKTIDDPMTVDDLLEDLEALKFLHGDRLGGMLIEVRNNAGDFDIATRCDSLTADNGQKTIGIF